MYQHLLVPIDGSQLSECATDASLELARNVDARVTGFAVEPLPPLPHPGSHPVRHTNEPMARTRLPLRVLH